MNDKGIYKPLPKVNITADDVRKGIEQAAHDMMSGATIEQWEEHQGRVNAPAYRTEKLQGIRAQLMEYITNRNFDTIPAQGENAPDDIHEARHALNLLCLIDNQWEAGSIGDVFNLAVVLGRIVERLHVRPFEPMVMTGKGHLRRMSGAREARTEQAEADRETILAAFRRRKANHPMDSDTYAISIVAEQTGFSRSKVERALGKRK